MVPVVGKGGVGVCSKKRLVVASQKEGMQEMFVGREVFGVYEKGGVWCLSGGRW